MTETEKLLQRQSRWQKARKELSWPEKIRMAEAIRSSAERWRSSAGRSTAEARRAPGDGPCTTDV